MIATIDLHLRAGPRRLIDALNWQTAPGECWCVIGRNGAGKSTLLRALAGVRDPDGGQIRIKGRHLQDWPLQALARERAYLPQARADAFGYSVLETVLAARHPYQGARYWESAEDMQTALQMLAALDVEALAGRDIRTLSGGERQRVAIAAALAQDTPLVLLDEPTSALDLAHQVSVMRLLTKLRDGGKTIVLVSHDLNLSHDVASHALLLMPDGHWHAGPKNAVMTPQLLGECLGHPVQVVHHQDRTLYIPAYDLPAQ